MPDLYVKPNPASQVDGQPVKVRDPRRNDFLPPEGRRVPDEAYWRRRLADGDVVPVEAAPTMEAPAATGRKGRA